MLKQISPVGSTQRSFFVSNTSTGADSRLEFDPFGATVKTNGNTPAEHAGAHGDIPNGGTGSIDSRFNSIANPAAGCALDGIFMPCSIALRGEGVSSDVVSVNQLFIDSRFRSLRNKAVWVEQDTSTAVRTGENELTIYAGPGGSYAWIPDPDSLLEVFTQSAGEPQNTVDLWKQAERAALRAVDLARMDDCRRFIENLAFAAFEKVAGPMSPEVADYIRKNNSSVDALLDKLGTSTWNIVDTPNESRALANEHTQTITFYRDFFGQRRTNDLILNNEDRTYYSPRTVTKRAQDLIHEGLHLLGPGFTDALLGELISGKAIKGSEDERRKKGSKIISDAVAVHCR